MTTRTYQLQLHATITVDDDTVKAAMIGTGLQGQPGDPEVTADEVFSFQEQMLALVERWTPTTRMQIFLVNRFVQGAAPVIVKALELSLPGSEVAVGDLLVSTGDPEADVKNYADGV